jgi:sugar O-acyltransferase (sialic acid O-acetyltransferase NeuD family)
VTDLIVLGAGGSAREIAGAVAEINASGGRWALRGFLDDDAARQGQSVDGLPVLGPLAAAREYVRASFVVGIASHRHQGLRQRIVEGLGLPPERFATLVHPSAWVSPRARLGAGTVVLQNVVVSPGATLGEHVLVSPGAQIAHDAWVGACTVLAPRVAVNGAVRIGEGAYVGAAAVIGPGVLIGPGALVGMGAVVLAAVPAGATAFGNPARTVSAGPERIRRWAP